MTCWSDNIHIVDGWIDGTVTVVTFRDLLSDDSLLAGGVCKLKPTILHLNLGGGICIAVVCMLKMKHNRVPRLGSQDGRLIVFSQDTLQLCCVIIYRCLVYVKSCNI